MENDLTRAYRLLLCIATYIVVRESRCFPMYSIFVWYAGIFDGYRHQNNTGEKVSNAITSITNKKKCTYNNYLTDAAHVYEIARGCSWLLKFRFEWLLPDK